MTFEYKNVIYSRLETSDKEAGLSRADRHSVLLPQWEKKAPQLSYIGFLWLAATSPCHDRTLPPGNMTSLPHRCFAN